MESCSSFSAMLAALALAGAASAARADVTYAYDDGLADHIIGSSSSDFDAIWMTRFSALPGGQIIHTIEFQIGRNGPNPPQPATVTLLLYEDPDDDMDPDDAVLVLSVPGVVVTNPNQDVLQSVAINPTTVSGHFFVGVFATATAGMFPIPTDDLSARGINGSLLTWLYAFDAPGTLDPSSPPPFLDLIDDFPHNGAFMIRAVGNPEPSSVALFGVALAALGALVRRRRRRVASSRE